MPSSNYLILLVASTNRKKREELHVLLADFPITVKGLSDFSDIREVEETGKTFSENASLKALGYAAQTGLLTLAEDSGLCCDALEDSPGIYSARFAGPKATDEENNRKLLQMFQGIPTNCRHAHYTSAIALAEPDRLIGTVEGEVHGYIHETLAGSGGFGYDPLFFYVPFGKTFGEVSAEMKHSVSHRAKALTKFKNLFDGYLKARTVS